MDDQPPARPPARRPDLRDLDAYHHPRKDPARPGHIDDIVLALHAYWQANPHKTLGQIVLSLPESPHVDLQNMSDGYAFARLQERTPQ